MKRTSIRLFTLAALSTACLAASLFGTVQAAPAPNAANAKLPVVAVQAVEMLPQTVSRRLAGRVTALHTVNITARVSGEIKEVAFADGALVKKGDVLYRLDDVQYQAALQSAKAAVMQAQAEALYAERDYKRQQALYEQKASSRDVLDAAERTAKTSAAALASAKAALITAEDNLKHCVIAAPMDGRGFSDHDPRHTGVRVSRSSPRSAFDEGHRRALRQYCGASKISRCAGGTFGRIGPFGNRPHHGG